MMKEVWNVVIKLVVIIGVGIIGLLSVYFLK